jgi:hypothetical protein
MKQKRLLEEEPETCVEQKRLYEEEPETYSLERLD